MINEERIANGLPALPRANVKFICEITQIVLDLWRKHYETLFGKPKTSRIKKKRDQLTKKIDKLRKKTARREGEDYILNIHLVR